LDVLLFNVKLLNLSDPWEIGGTREKMAKERFEEALNKLEKIVSKLEKGDIPLDESLKLFEEGVRLSRWCNHKLDEAERRVEILVKDKEGVLKAQPFDPSTSSGQALSTGSGEGVSGKSDENGFSQPEDSLLNEKE
jgi:exodeoxyribonuclease VII small subunit